MRSHDDWGVYPWGESPPLVERILAIPAYAEQYRRYLRQLIEPGTGPFTLAVIGPRIDAMRTLIEPFAFTGSFAGGNMDWGYTHQNFLTSYTYPGDYRNWPSGWDHGLEPYITDRTQFLDVDVPTPPPLPGVRINEVVASNRSGLQDETGEYEDWVELMNAGTAPVDLTGMYLTDNPGDPTRWMIPPGLTIAAGEFVVLWCDEEPAEGPLHAGFKLDDDGEGVGIYGTDAAGIVLIDYMPYPELPPDQAFGRVPDGGTEASYLETPTPGAPNSAFGNVPPVVTGTRHEPAAPSAGATTTITALLRDLDGDVVAGTVYYDAGAGFVDIAMFDDGLHGDGEADDDVYGAHVPGQPGGVTVSYYVAAQDDLGAIRTDPDGAPTETHVFVVGFEPPPLFVNEFLASNSNVMVDEFGEFDDWVEIFNAGAVPFDLAGMGLSDDLLNPDRYVFPAVPEVVLQPGGHLLIWCDSQPAQGPLHAGFKLAAAGEQIGLFAGAAQGWAPIDSLTFGAQTTDVSFGRDPDGGPAWVLYASPTPGWQNGLLIGVDGGAPAAVLRLGRARPHPLAAEGGRIDFSLARPGVTALRVYDVGGRHVRTLVDGTLAAGTHDVGWDGRDARGRRLAAGVYFLRLDAEGDVRTSRIVIAR